MFSKPKLCPLQRHGSGHLVDSSFREEKKKSRKMVVFFEASCFWLLLERKPQGQHFYKQLGEDRVRELQSFKRVARDIPTKTHSASRSRPLQEQGLKSPEPPIQITNPGLPEPIHQIRGCLICCRSTERNADRVSKNVRPRQPSRLLHEAIYRPPGVRRCLCHRPSDTNNTAFVRRVADLRDWNSEETKLVCQPHSS